MIAGVCCNGGIGRRTGPFGYDFYEQNLREEARRERKRGPFLLIG